MSDILKFLLQFPSSICILWNTVPLYACMAILCAGISLIENPKDKTSFFEEPSAKRSEKTNKPRELKKFYV